MIKWALIFFVVALIAVVLGAGGVASLAAGAGKWLLIAAVVIAIVAAVFGRGHSSL
jgi:uncharacterized membrane protein YtjA (UPF0391 family)